MKWTILGSGGCTVIPKPLCDCSIRIEAREKGIPYARVLALLSLCMTSNVMQMNG